MSGYTRNNASVYRGGPRPVATPHGVAYSSRVKFVKPTCTNKQHVFVSSSTRKAPNNRKMGHVPGYSGTIPHIEQVLGRSFGRATRRAFRKSAIQLFIEDSIPPAPHATNRIKVPRSSYERAGGRMPGYTGFMPNATHCYGTTFGATALRSGSYHDQTQVQQRQKMNSTSLRLASAPTPRKASRFF